ncbi:stalk domain-containing protein [Halobacillus salinus]|uniref:Copper amine oxidase-like N-terminal domain-containing protein n=1 Tax=Halobacillus salinus TaxID=192814 RepID=A0A4Z0H583_9BACI|nr:stalk domain-containing protein [Halobacillus salinus]TGB05027.1 hypothetical protein E4663_08540 [Halobacillus salinus]
MRRVIFASVLFLSISCLLLLYQWEDFEQPAPNKHGSLPSPTINIDIKLLENTYVIHYTFEEWLPGTYEVSFPEESRMIRCSHDCLKEKDNSTAEWEFTGEEQLSYELPFGNQDKLTEWNLKFRQGERYVKPEYKLSLEDYSQMEHTWVGVTSKKSDIRKDLVRYYQFEKTNRIHYPLVLVKDSSKKVWRSGEWVVTYPSSSPISEDTKRYIRALENQYQPALVELNQESAAPSGGYLSVKSVYQIEHALFLQQIKSLYPDASREWAIPVLSQLFFDKSLTEMERSQAMAGDILAVFSEEEVETIKQKLLRNDASATLVTKVDELLSQVYGMHTTFFSQNKESGSYVPLYFLHSKPVISPDQTMDEDAVELGREMYLPLKPLLNLAGYSFTPFPKDKLFLVELPGRSYRFFLNRSTFIMNEQEFGMATDLLRKVDGRIFMKRHYVEELLNINVAERENSIIVQKK